MKTAWNLQNLQLLPPPDNGSTPSQTHHLLASGVSREIKHGATHSTHFWRASGGNLGSSGLYNILRSRVIYLNPRVEPCLQIFYIHANSISLIRGPSSVHRYTRSTPLDLLLLIQVGRKHVGLLFATFDAFLKKRQSPSLAERVLSRNRNRNTGACRDYTALLRRQHRLPLTPSSTPKLLQCRPPPPDPAKSALALPI